MYNYNHIHKHYHNHKLISHLPPYLPSHTVGMYLQKIIVQQSFWSVLVYSCRLVGRSSANWLGGPMI